MKIADRIPIEQKQQLEKLQSPKKKKQKRKNINDTKTKKKKEEKLSFKDIEELMGVHMDTFERRRGAVRRK